MFCRSPFKWNPHNNYRLFIFFVSEQSHKFSRGSKNYFLPLHIHLFNLGLALKLANLSRPSVPSVLLALDIKMNYISLWKWNNFTPFSNFKQAYAEETPYLPLATTDNYNHLTILLKSVYTSSVRYEPRVMKDFTVSRFFCFYGAALSSHNGAFWRRRQ